MNRFFSPYLKHDVELTYERERHIAERHPDLLPGHSDKLREAVTDPDQVRRSARFGGAKLFSRWFADLRTGNHVVVVVVSDFEPPQRHWIITAYIARRLTQGEVEWTRS